MKLSDLTRDIRKMSDAELREHVRAIRHSKYVERPAAAARKQKVVKRAGNKAETKIRDMLAGMTDAERAVIINALEGR